MRDIQDKELSDKEMLRYARQILLSDWDIDAQTRLKNSCVLIIGMGGLGCPVAETLVRAGVGHLHIVDEDIIDSSNLQRQTLFLPTDIGYSKVLTAKHRLEKINEFVKITAYQPKLTSKNFQNFIENIHDYLNLHGVEKLNLILDCTDNFSTRDSINQMSVCYKIPLLSAAAIAQRGQLALFEPQYDTGCYHCLFDGGEEENEERHCINTGVLATTTAIVGNLQAQIALTYLGLHKNPIKQMLVLWQGETLNLRKIRYQRNLNCQVCQKKFENNAKYV